MTMERLLIIGLGNPYLTDDGAGIRVAEDVAQALPADTPIDIIEVSVGGLTLMEAMIGYDRVLVIDALWSPPDEVGRVLVFDAGYLPETLNSASTHDVDLPTALKIGRHLGVHLPEDEHIQIIGITANQVLDFGDEPSPAVKAAIPSAVAQVLELCNLMEV